MGDRLGIPGAVGFILFFLLGFPGGSEVKASACIAGNLGSIPGLGRSPGEGNGNLLQYSCLESPMDRRAWQAPVHRVLRGSTRVQRENARAPRNAELEAIVAVAARAQEGLEELSYAEAQEGRW